MSPFSLFFLCIMHSLYNILLLFILPIFWHLQYHNDVGKMFSCSQSGLLSQHLKTSNDDSYSLRCSSWSRSSLSCVFFHHFLRDGEAPSRVTTVLTQCDTRQVLHFYGDCLTLMTHSHNKMKKQNNVFHVCQVC